jgi:hypothetical protein
MQMHDFSLKLMLLLFIGFLKSLEFIWKWHISEIKKNTFT